MHAKANYFAVLDDDLLILDPGAGYVAGGIYCSGDSDLYRILEAILRARDGGGFHWYCHNASCWIEPTEEKFHLVSKSYFASRNV